MKEREYFEDYEVDEKLIGPSRTITEADIVNFAMITGDWHPIHINKEYAKTTIFGERIAHGMLTLTLGSALCMQMGPNTYSPKSFIAFITMTDIIISNPTKIGDTLSWEGTVASLEPKSKNRGVIGFDCEIKNQRGETCLTYKHKMLVGQKPK